MEAYIRNKSDKNKSRYGKVIPKYETKIDIKSYFGRDDDTFIKQLMNDSDLEVNLVKSAGTEIRQKAIDLENEKKEELRKEDEIKKRGRPVR